MGVAPGLLVRPHRLPLHAPVASGAVCDGLLPYRALSVATHASGSLRQHLPVEPTGTRQSWDGTPTATPPPGLPFPLLQLLPRDHVYYGTRDHVYFDWGYLSFHCPA